MDDADRAQEHMEREEALRRKYAPKERQLQPTGHCYNCEREVAAPKLFCDAECTQEFEWILKRVRTQAMEV